MWGEQNPKTASEFLPVGIYDLHHSLTWRVDQTYEYEGLSLP